MALVSLRLARGEPIKSLTTPHARRIILAGTFEPRLFMLCRRFAIRLSLLFAGIMDNQRAPMNNHTNREKGQSKTSQKEGPRLQSWLTQPPTKYQGLDSARGFCLPGRGTELDFEPAHNLTDAHENIDQALLKLLTKHYLLRRG